MVGGHVAALASQRSGLGVFAPVEFYLRRFHLGLDDAISALIEARGGYQQRSRRMPGDQRLSPSLTPSKTYTNPDRSTTSGKNRSSRRALHLGSSDGLNHPDINNKDLDDDSRRVSVPGPPRGGRVFNPSKGKGGFNNATSSQRRVNEPDAPWATRLRLKLRDPRVMTDEDRINNIEDPSENDDVLRGTLEDLRALYTPGNEKPEGFEVSLTSPRSCIVCLKAGCDPSSLVPRPDPGKFILVILVILVIVRTGN